jgi:type IV secretory pathway VirB10-like protein
MDDKEQQKETQQPVTPPQGPIDKRKIGIGLILVIILIIGAAEFSSNSGGSPVPATKPKTAPVKSQPTEPGLIGNFERQTTEDAQELARIKAQKEALAQTLAAAQAVPSPFPAATYPYGTEAHAQTGETPSLAALERQRQIAAAGYYPQTSSRTQTPSVPDQIAAERKKREYQSLYASNVALDLRSQPKLTSQPVDTPETTTPIEQIRIPPDQPMKQPVSDSTDTAPDRKKAYDLDSATGKSYRLFEGRIIETVLTNRLNGAFSGPVDCMVTTDVYSHDNQTLLIPEGSRILGKVSAVQSGQQQRLFVAFHRIIMPDGYSVSLDQFTGLNQIGETGLRDLVNHHYLQIFGSSLALAAIGGVAQIGNGASAFTYDPMSQVRNGMSQSMAESSQRVLDRFLNQLPTFVIRERTRVKIYLSDDLLLPAYANHTTPRDL